MPSMPVPELANSVVYVLTVLSETIPAVAVPAMVMPVPAAVKLTKEFPTKLKPPTARFTPPAYPESTFDVMVHRWFTTDVTPPKIPYPLWFVFAVRQVFPVIVTSLFALNPPPPTLLSIINMHDPAKPAPRLVDVACCTTFPDTVKPDEFSSKCIALASYVPSNTLPMIVALVTMDKETGRSLVLFRPTWPI